MLKINQKLKDNTAPREAGCPDQEDVLAEQLLLQHPFQSADQGLWLLATTGWKKRNLIRRCFFC
jgi:hypothetical protein